ncbi:MAG TPA: hypothetical protein VHA52_12705 [Candidatus Babeliaceae bacterium]|nr:hypothetical protein [Candidatus Babeliaceae bacterium]
MIRHIPADGTAEIGRRNPRNRVSYVKTKNIAGNANIQSGTCYTYDIHGNADRLLQATV